MRKLNSLENMFLLAGGEDGCLASIIVELKLRGSEFNPESMKKSCQRLHSHYQLLRQRIDTKNFCYQPASREPCYVHLKNNKAASAILEEELLQSPMNDDESPLWRLTSMERSNQKSVAVVLTIHHAAVDAVSIQQIFSELLQSYYEFENNLEHSNQSPSEPLDFEYYLSVADKNRSPSRYWSRRFLATPVRWGIFFSRTILPRILLKSTDVHDTNPTRILCQQIPIANLKRVARENQTTVNSLVSSSFLLAYQQATQKQNIAIMEAVNLRPEFNIPNSSLGLHVFSVANLFKLKPKQAIHELAAKHQQRLRKGRLKLSRQLPLLPFVLTKKQAQTLKRRLPKIGHGRGADMLLSNWGQQVIEVPDCFSVETVYFRASYDLVGSRLQVGVVTVGDRLCINLGFQEKTFGAAEAREICTRAIKTLSDISSEA